MSVEVTTHDGIAHLILDDPPLNILTCNLLEELRGALAELTADHSLRVLVVSARGDHFSAGASVAEHLPSKVGVMIPDFVETIREVDAFPVPVIFAVHGRCLGGGLELVLAGDMIVAAENAHFGVPEIRLGVFPPVACVRLPHLVAPGLAAELIYTGASIDADAARSAGLVLRVVPREDVVEEAMSIAREVAGRSAAALRETKKALRAARGDLGALDEVSGIYLRDLMATADAVEGLTSFMEKRLPEWRHA